MSDSVTITDEQTTDQQRLQHLHDLAAEATKLGAEWEGLKAQASHAKKVYEAAMERLRDAAMDDDDLPLFDEQGNDEAWKNASVSVLDLPADLITLLQDKGVMTLGHLNDYMLNGAEFGDEEVTDAIVNAWLSFAANHPGIGAEETDDQDDE